MDEYQPDLPAERWAKIRFFVEDAAASAAPLCAYSMRRLLTVSSHYVDWAHNRRGYQLDARVLFRRELIDVWVADRKSNLSEGTRRNYRAILCRIAEVVLPEAHPKALTPLNRRSSVVPYSESDLILLERWAVTQSTAVMRRNAVVLLSLASGAGIWSREIGDIRRSDIVSDEQGLLVRVPGDRAREVPLLRRYEPMLSSVLQGLASDDLVFGAPQRQNYDNLITNFVARSRRSSRMPQPRAQRMRATWLVTHLAARTDIKALMRAGGIDKFENLAQLLRHVPELDTAEYRRQLRAETSR